MHQALLVGAAGPLREFLHADDLGEACVFVLENWQPSHDELPYLNVGTGVDLSIRELAAEVAAATDFVVRLTGTPANLMELLRNNSM